MATPKNSAATEFQLLLVGTLDTKGHEIGFLRERLQQAGLSATVVDIGVLHPPLFPADVPRQEIACAGGARVSDLAESNDRGNAVSAMHRGFVAWVRERRKRGLQDAMIAIGGSAGTAIATAGMQEMSLGAPKLMLSTMASGDVRPYVGTSDICMMYSVADFSGLNRLTRLILTRAADAMAGMCHGPADRFAASDRPVVAATMFGNTTPCVNRVQQVLEQKGFELLVFHATGTGGSAMERLAEEGFLQGVVDITTTELADELVGGVLSAGPHRLEAAGRIGLPQVVSVGALDMVNFGAPETVPAKFQGRLLYQHNPAVTLMRTAPDENEQLGRMLACKLNRATGPAALLLPLQGVSELSRAGNAFHDRVADERLFAAIRANLESSVELMELDMHINDPEFALAVAEAFLNLTQRAVQPASEARVPSLQHGQGCSARIKSLV